MHTPTGLRILYDDRCPFCVRCAEWLRDEPTLLPIEIVGCSSERARERYGRVPWLGRELVVISEAGDVWDVWAGPAAFLVCLWGLARWRGWAVTLAEQPTLAAFAHRLFAWISRRRHWLAGFVGHHPCRDGVCLAPSPGGPYR